MTDSNDLLPWDKIERNPRRCDDVVLLQRALGMVRIRSRLIYDLVRERRLREAGDHALRLEHITRSLGVEEDNAVLNLPTRPDWW